MRKIIMMIMLMFMMGATVMAQSTAQADIGVTATTISGMQVEILRNVDFGEVVAGTGMNIIDHLSADSGKLRATGSQNTTVLVSYPSTVTLIGTNDVNNELVFTMGDISANSEDIQSSSTIITDSFVFTSTVETFLWIGGSVNVLSTTPLDTYNGTITIEFAYE